MTSQPNQSDPDRVILEEDLLDVDRDDDLADDDLADEEDGEPAIIVAAMTESEISQPPAYNGNGGPGPQWHDIQAMFVDDPRGSVQLAAQAADAAVAALVETLRQRRAALAPGGGVPRDPRDSDPGDTEQLREALRSYRIFCQSLADLGQQLPPSQAMAR